MIRNLLATTALAALLTSGAFAQDAAAPAAPAATTETPAVADPAAPTANVESGATEVTDINEPWDMSAGYVAVDTDNLGTRLIGQPVYSSTGDDAEEIGTITDIVFDESGQINAVVLGVGGFLGIGEKSVAVDFDALEFTLAADNTERWVLPTTADALNAAPDFVWQEDEPVDVNNNAMAPADPAMAPADPAMAPADPAMAPADPAMAPADNAMAPMAMPREGYNTIEVDALTADNLIGATVIGPDGNDIAEVGDLLLAADGALDAMLVDFGGFLGLGQKTVAVSMDNLEFAANENGDLVVYSDFTREQLEAAPEYDEAAYAADPSLRATDM
jgi:sporulation protein YlmC with PRC-barrel domain